MEEKKINNNSYLCAFKLHREFILIVIISTQGIKWLALIKISKLIQENS